MAVPLPTAAGPASADAVTDMCEDPAVIAALSHPSPPLGRARLSRPPASSAQMGVRRSPSWSLSVSSSPRLGPVAPTPNLRVNPLPPASHPREQRHGESAPVTCAPLPARAVRRVPSLRMSRPTARLLPSSDAFNLQGACPMVSIGRAPESASLGCPPPPDPPSPRGPGEHHHGSASPNRSAPRPQSSPTQRASTRARGIRPRSPLARPPCTTSRWHARGRGATTIASLLPGNGALGFRNLPARPRQIHDCRPARPAPRARSRRGEGVPLGSRHAPAPVAGRPPAVRGGGGCGCGPRGARWPGGARPPPDAAPHRHTKRARRGTHLRKAAAGDGG